MSLNKYYCKFWDGRTIPNVSIEAIEFDDRFHVEIWDVTSEYHSLNMFDEDKKKNIEIYSGLINKLKSTLCGKKEQDAPIKEKIEELKSQISARNKYKNKRLVYSKEDFHNEFEVIGASKTRKFEFIEEYENKYPFALKDMNEGNRQKYFDSFIKGTQYTVLT